jgi:hypothetical protein
MYVGIFEFLHFEFSSFDFSLRLLCALCVSAVKMGRIVYRRDAEYAEEAQREQRPKTILRLG